MKKLRGNIYIYLINILLNSFLLSFVLSSKNLKRYEYNYESIIQITIKETGYSYFLSNDYKYEPSEVIINDNPKGDSYKKSFNFDKNINYVIIKFNDTIDTCKYMFYNLTTITEIDLSKFDASKVKDMNSMFHNSVNLENIKFGNFNTSAVKDMDSLFFNCQKLTSIDISNFDTSSVTYMGRMFWGCNNLTSIDLSKFNTSRVESMFCMFLNCDKLTELNLSNFDTSQVTEMTFMFHGCKALKYLDLSNFNTSNIKYLNNTFYGCESLAHLNLYSFVIKNNTNVSIDNIFYDINPNVQYCIYDIETQIYLLGNNSISNCSYYCIEQKNNKFDLDNNICVKSCDKTLYEYKNICYKECPSGTLPNEIINICNDNKTETSIENQNNFLKNIQESLLDGYDTSNIDNGTDLIHSDNKYTYTITSTSNQKNNKKNDNKSTIDLGNCENKLKEVYHISKNDSLYILKIDAFLEGLNAPKIEYEVYYPFTPNNLTKLDLIHCKDIKIDLYIPINISIDDLYKYNKSADLFNDICSTMTSESGTDETLKDRQNEFVENNMSICEEDCDMGEYDNETKKVLCSCYTKIDLPLISEIKVDKNKLLSNFADINNIANFKLLKCFSLLLDKKTFLRNSANYMFIILLLLLIISLFTFFTHDRIKIKKDINRIIKFKKIEKTEDNINITTNNFIKTTKRKNRNKKQKLTYIHKRTNKNDISENTNNKTEKKSKKRKHSNKVNNQIIKIQINNINNANNNNNKNKKKMIKFIKDKSSKLKKNKKDNDKSDKTLNIEYLMKEKSKAKLNYDKYNDTEINLLNYSEAKKYDKRSYFQYYLSLLKTKHILIFTFIQNKDYNSRMIKIYLFFYTFAMNYVLSAMFYSDDTMHKIYVDEGSFDFTYQLPQMFYSLLISSVLIMILNLFGLWEQNILNIKKSKLHLIKQIITKESNRIKCKAILFFIITFILSFVFWAYLGCFCAVYTNTQIHLITDVSSSFGLSFITPLIIYLFPGIFRIISLKGKKAKKPFLYKLSQFLQML